MEAIMGFEGRHFEDVVVAVVDVPHDEREVPMPVGDGVATVNAAGDCDEAVNDLAEPVALGMARGGETRQDEVGGEKLVHGGGCKLGSSI